MLTEPKVGNAEMQKLIDYWVVKVFANACDEDPVITGYQQSTEPEIKAGFIIVRDMGQTSLRGFPLSKIGGFSIDPVFKEEK